MAKSPVSNATSTHANAGSTEVQPDREASIHDEIVGHGNSPAAWTCVMVMILGAAIASIAYIIAGTILFWGGIAVMLIGLVIGYFMKKAGYGVGGSRLDNDVD